MIYTPFEFPVPAPHSASFTDGEKAVSVATPLASAPARSERMISRWIYLAPGFYTMHGITKTSGTWLLNSVRQAGSTLVEEKQLLFTTLASQGVVDREFYVSRGGVKKLDIILRNISTSAGECYAAFNIKRSGNLIYASDNEGWVASDTNKVLTSQMPALPDYRKSLPVFTLTPNWQGGILEKLEYLTNVLPSSTDAEQRRMLRVHPRRSFEVSFLREKDERARLDSFVSGHGHEPFLVPLWHEAVRLPYGDPKETAEIPFDGYNLISNGAHLSNGSQMSCGLDLLFDLISDGSVTSDGTQLSDGYED